MSKKFKIILPIIALTITIILMLTTIINASADNLSYELPGRGSSTIGSVYKLNYNESLEGNTGLYCIQVDKYFSGRYDTDYVVRSYVEIDGKQTKVYTESNGEPSIVKSDLSAQMAYILNQNQGYGYEGAITDAQYALWHITNDWTTEIFGDNTYSWEPNSYMPANSINDAAIEYAANIGDVTSEGITTDSSTISDNTNKSNISIVYVDGYNRIGPFNWYFDGTLDKISVTGDKGTVSDSDVRFVKYSGTDEKIVSASEIESGDDFYVDVKVSTGMKKLLGLKLTTAVPDPNIVYKANVWFLQSTDSQNVIYTEISQAEGKPLEGNGRYNVELTKDLSIKKVDDRDTTVPLSNVGFKFKANVYRPIRTGNGYVWQWVERYLDSNLNWGATSIEDAVEFKTDNNGVLKLKDMSAEITQKGSLKAIEVSNPHYGYTIGKIYDVSENAFEEKLGNHQKYVKLSGYVWLDLNDGKTSLRDNTYNEGKENGINGIKVYLKDMKGNTIKTTTTSELNLYSEINGGEYQFVDIDLDEVQKGSYYITFEYCGVQYQSVNSNINENTGSKAIDTTSRNVLDSKFTSVDATGTQTLNVNGVTANYKANQNYASELGKHIDNNYNYSYNAANTHTGCDVEATTSEAKYDIYKNFKPASEEIRYINLGLYEKPQADFALVQDLYNVRTTVNGYEHIYRYASVRYSNNGNDVEENSSWNVGVKFQKNNGTYQRAIYTSDANYVANNHKDNELKVYVTYKIALKNESSYLGKINSIVNYSDSRYELVAIGTAIDDKDNITNAIEHSDVQKYNNEYSKYIINVNTTLNANESKYIYVQYKMDKNAVITILNNGELLNNVSEINSYVTYKDNNVNTPVSAFDKDSVPGNAVPGKTETYEDDTDAARSLQLELKNERAVTGTIFEDSTGKDSNTVYQNQERLGNGIYDNGEKTISGVTVTLREIGKDDSSYDNERVVLQTVSDENGNFKIEGFVPGKYTLTYTWGDKNYTVQYYKGTIYDSTRNKEDLYWYKETEPRKTDAMDSYDIRNTIDNEMEKVKTNILDSEIKAAYENGSEYIKTTKMDSTTSTMEFSVEYETTITDGNDDKVEFIAKNVDFGIVERAKQQVSVSKRVSGFKITLANGQVLADATISEDGKLQGTHPYTTYMGPSTAGGIQSDGLVRVEVDPELIEGAKVEITYEIKVTNVGELDYVTDKYYYYGDKTGADKVKVSVTGLLDYAERQITVLDDKWEQKDDTIYTQINAKYKDVPEYTNLVYPYYTDKLTKELVPNESISTTMYVSKLLTSTTDIQFNNEAEISEITKTDTFNSGSPAKVDDNGHFISNKAEKFVIIPSTGENKNYTMLIIIGITSMVVLGLGIFGIRKFIRRDK